MMTFSNANDHRNLLAPEEATVYGEAHWAGNVWHSAKGLARSFAPMTTDAR